MNGELCAGGRKCWEVAFGRRGEDCPNNPFEYGFLLSQGEETCCTMEDTES